MKLRSGHIYGSEHCCHQFGIPRNVIKQTKQRYNYHKYIKSKLNDIELSITQKCRYHGVITFNELIDNLINTNSWWLKLSPGFHKVMINKLWVFYNNKDWIKAKYYLKLMKKNNLLN